MTTTAEEILNKREQLSAYLTKEPEWWKEDIIMAMEEYAQLKLSEHSTKEQEVVCWHVKTPYGESIQTDERLVDLLETIGATITPLVKKTV